MNDNVVIVAAKRSPLGAFGGAFKHITAPDLAGQVIASLMQEEIQPDEVIMGCVCSAGMRQAPARQAALAAGLSEHIPATTINKVCGSGLQSVIVAYDAIRSGRHQCVIAGGMENMSRTPYLSEQTRFGKRFGHAELKDHLVMDGLENAYGKNELMGVFADKTAAHYGFTREDIDAFSRVSCERAIKAVNGGYFKDEITPVTLKSRRGEKQIDTDEIPGTIKLEKMSSLRSAFSPDGTTTAGNASALSDGAAAIMLMSETQAKKLGLTPLATIKAISSYATDPAWFTTAPSVAIKRCLEQADWKSSEVDLYEINEAFAVVAMATMHELDLSHDCVNVRGGAVALGHPLGATGARILVTLVHAMQQKKLQRGILSLCIGGGEALAMAIESIHE